MSRIAHALRLNVYTPSYGECSNFGITHTYDDVLVLCHEGPVKIDLDDPPKNLMRLERGTVAQKAKTLRLVPATGDTTDLIGPMMGGCYASTSDSRWHRILADYVGKENAYIASAVPIHDRYETQDQYDALSR